MRRLLLLFIISPLILFGQTRRKAIVDSFKAATNLHDISAIMSNYPDIKVAHIQAADSGDYVTIVVRVRVPEGTIAAITLQPFVNISAGDIVTADMSTVTVPSMLFPVAEALTPLAVTQISVGDVVAGPVDIVPVPSVLFPVAEALTPLASVQFRIDDIATDKLVAVPVPPIPDIVLEAEALPPLAAVKLAVAHFSFGKLDIVAVPDFEQKKMPVTEMCLSANGYSLLEKMEGFSPEPYSLKDGGQTIGFGFFVPDGEGSKWDKGVTWEQAEVIIRQKMPAYENQVKRYINVPLTQEEFDALTMMAYNLGGFSKATSIVNDINSYADFDQLQKDWLRFVHSKAPGVMKGLANRRKDELKVRAESNYQPERKIQIFKNRK